MSLHVAMTSLLGIQVGSVGWQFLHHDLGVLTPRDFYLGGAMGLQAIPDYKQWAGEASLEMPQEDNDVGSVDRMIEVPLVDPPRQCQGIAVDTSRRLLTRRRTGVRSVGAHIVPGRLRTRIPSHR